jgi:hypothetical protein
MSLVDECGDPWLTISVTSFLSPDKWIECSLHLIPGRVDDLFLVVIQLPTMILLKHAQRQQTSALV